ncbi:FAD-binding oxidoreductase [Streptococcus sp. X16XC17]|uniref:NAD(P)/FAD-dependent oxidoreductase n=1 Tax=unclassified Streptococcus TaxID=2608887 RepID=UPI00066FCD79|nr:MULTISPECIES: FAD-binding oxidoreductase [unclassified Streptococcus]TCD46241.1 FAD-binding oxidoreductase [Streptococcus sp. X16XC17]
MKQEIIIIGGGIVGSTAAFYLSKEPTVKVTLIDEGTGSATRAAAGIICPWLSQRRNKEWYRLTSQGAAFYPTLMADLEKSSFKPAPYKQTGTLVFKNQEKLLKKLEKIAHKRLVDAPMIGDLELYQSQELAQVIPQLETDQGAILASGGGRVDGGLLLDQLQSAFIQNGGEILYGKAQLASSCQVKVQGRILSCDKLILTVGTWLPDLLEPLGYHVDVRPQKGQLLEIQTHFATDDWPGCMLHGEIDILPFENGKLVIGATHEDDMGYDLTLDEEKISHMKATAEEFIPALKDYDISATRIGTRAYTSDYSPFFGPLIDQPNVQVASGLGSSGLTSGPFIGWQLAQAILQKPISFDASPYSPNSYIEKTDL